MSVLDDHDLLTTLPSASAVHGANVHGAAVTEVHGLHELDVVVVGGAYGTVTFVDAVTLDGES